MSIKKFLLLILFLGITINIYIALEARNNYANKKHIKQEKEQQLTLENLHASFSFINVYKNKFKNLFNIIENKTIPEMQKIYKEWCAQVDMPTSAFTIIAYNVPDVKAKTHNNSTVLNVPESEKDDWEFVMSQLDKNDYSNNNLVLPENKKRIIRILKSGIGFSKISRRPEILEKIGSGNINTYAVWYKANKEVASDKINSVLILAHENYIESRTDSIAKIFFKQRKLNSARYGYLNSKFPAKSYLPHSLSSISICKELEKEDIKSGFKIYEKLGISAYSKPNGNVFIALNDKPFTPIPIWTIAVFFLWFPIWFKYYITASGNIKLSLKMLSTIMFILVIIQPVYVIANYWEKLLESKRSTIKESKITAMLNNLVQIDACEVEIENIFLEKLHNMVNIVKKTDENPLAANNPQKLQELVDRSLELELEGLYDICIIMNNDGKLLRNYSSLSSFVRRLALFPKYFQDELLNYYNSIGWLPLKKELLFFEKYSNENFDIKQFLQLTSDDSSKIINPLAKSLTREIIDIYNSKHEIGNTSDQKLYMPTSALITSATGENNQINSLYNSIGDYYRFGYNEEQALSYIDILLDKNDKSTYGIILFSGIYNFTNSYLRRIFLNNDLWPKDTKFMALANKKLTINYPYVDLLKRLPQLSQILQPPLNQYSGEVKINGIPNLLCAHKSNKIINYILISTMPISALDKEINKFEIQMLAALMFVVLILGFTLIRVYKLVLEPTKKVISGIKAMQNNDYDYRIDLKSSDEWEKLADTFNQSLESMKELEVATFIQNTILPSGIIKNKNIEFSGKTVSADGIGGDYYDAFIPEENKMMFLFGDVSGHSVSAALVVSMAHAGFAALFDSGIYEPSEILKSFSNLMLNNLKRVKMMTCFAGFIDENGNMLCSNAGQTFPMIVDDKGNVTKVSVIGYPLGSAKRAKFKQTTIQLPDTCRIVLYSDGIIEAMNKSGQPFGYERFEALVKEMGCNNTIEEFKTRMYNELHKFSDPVPWNDDCSIAIIDYKRN